MATMITIVLVLLCCLTLELCVGIDVKGFDDNVLYYINWLDHMRWKRYESIHLESPEIKTVVGNPLEVYQCAMPVANKNKASENDYNGPTPFELVSALFSSTMCSHRIESYWTYELCHGHYIKQFHEEREGKVTKIQEFYLGKWNKQKTEAMLELQALTKNSNGTKSISPAGTTTKYKKVLTTNVPYVEVVMTDGTVCDLTNKPRVTSVLYVCDLKGKNEVFSLKETSSCNYEVIILTAILCSHPNYKREDVIVNVINCGAVYSYTPRKPRTLMTMELESMKMQHQKLPDMTDKLKDIAVVNFKDGALKMDILQADQLRSILNKHLQNEETETKVTAVQPQTPPQAPPQIESIKVSNTVDDTTPVTAFLRGKNCLTGGTGWWKYEFCYGRYVRQFHQDKNGEKSLLLGHFNEARHRQWIRMNPLKRPIKTGPGKLQMTHFYADGSRCEKTGEKRQTEVKLKCMEKAPSPAAVALYLLEPKTCQYILGVESPLICDIITKVDDDGVIVLPSRDVGDIDGGTDAEQQTDDLFLGNVVVEDLEVRFEND